MNCEEFTQSLCFCSLSLPPKGSAQLAPESQSRAQDTPSAQASGPIHPRA